MSLTVFLQILLGGWTSTNYAALICPTFPFCHGTLLPAMALAKGFNFMSPIGQNYEFGLLGEHARIAIQMVHRWGALITTVVLLSGGIWLLKRHTQTRIKTCVYLVFFVLTLQVILGILNIAWLLPIEIAVAHNGVGLWLLLSCISTLFFIRQAGHQ